MLFTDEVELSFLGYAHVRYVKRESKCQRQYFSSSRDEIMAGAVDDEDVDIGYSDPGVQS